MLDNASSDGSADAVQRTYPEVTVIEQPFRAGFGANHNRILRATDTPYVLLLNDDASFGPGVLQALTDFLDFHPAAAAVGPRILGADGSPTDSAWRFPSLGVVALFAVTGGRLRFVQSRGNHARRVELLSASALLLRRSAIEAIGLFDEGYFMYSEDTDLLLRLRNAGWEAWFLPSTVVHHAGGASSARLKRERVVEEWRSRRRFWMKHYGRATACACSVLRGVPYAAVGLILGVAHVLPGRRCEALRATGRLLRWQAANAWLGARGPGLREVANAWNTEQARGTNVVA